MRGPSARSIAAAIAPLALPQPNTSTERHDRRRESTDRPCSECSTSGTTSAAASAACQMDSAASRAGGDTGGHSRRAAALPRHAERWGVWGAMSAPPIVADKATELLQALSLFAKHIVRLREAEPYLRATELAMGVERRAGHRGHAAFLDEPHRERVVVVDPRGFHEMRGIRQDVVRAARLVCDEAGRLDVAPEQIAAVLIAVAQLHIVVGGETEGGHGRLLQRVRRAHRHEVVSAPNAH